MESRYDMLNAKCFMLLAIYLGHALCEMRYAIYECVMRNALCEMRYAKCVRPRPMHEFQLPRPRQLPWKLHVSQCKLDGFLTSTDEGLRVYLPLLYPVFEIRGGQGGGVMHPPMCLGPWEICCPRGPREGLLKTPPPKKKNFKYRPIA